MKKIFMNFYNVEKNVVKHTRDIHQLWEISTMDKIKFRVVVFASKKIKPVIPSLNEQTENLI